MLSSYRHKNIIKVFGYCVERGKLMLVCEFIPIGSLASFLFGGGGKISLNWTSRISFAAGAANAVSFLHQQKSNPVILGDVNSSDILIQSDNISKISNFSYSMLAPLQIDGCVMGMQGLHPAPECRKGMGLSRASDVYCLGIVLLEMLTGSRISLSRKSSMVVVNEVADQRIGRFPKRDFISVMDLAKRCLHETPAMRPDISAIARKLEEVRRHCPEPPTHLPL